MPLLTSLVLAGSAVVVGIAAYRKANPSPLIEVLIDGKPKVATLLPPEPQAAMTRVQQQDQTLFEDRRNQQLRSVLSRVDQQEINETERKYNRDLGIALGALGLSIGGVFITPILGVLSLPGIVYGSRTIFSNSYTCIVEERRVSLDVLNAIIITTFIATGHYVLANVPIVLTALRRKLVNKIKDDSRSAIVDVFRQQPRSARVLTDGVAIEIPYDTLAQEHIVVVNAGETIPVDGTILDGAATVDQHILTGEAQPVEKGIGDSVFALTVILSGHLHIQIDKTGQATTAAQIGETLNQTVEFKTNAHLRAEETVDRMVFPTLLIGGLGLPAIGVSGAMGVLNAPPVHNVTISSAICMLTYLNLASKHGILMKDGRTLELLNQVDTVVFDKTGTLTEEQPYVGRIYAYNGVSEAAVLRYTAAAESHQTHPIARAVRQEARARGLSLPALDEAEYKVGYGVSVVIKNRSVHVGSTRFMEMLGIDIPPEASEAQVSCYTQGHSLVLMAIDRNVVGAIELCPTIRPEALEIIQRLRQRHVKSIYIISGDHDTPTKLLANTLKVDHYFAEILPEDKATLVEQLQQTGKSVCFVGDGINDSIALKTAHVSVSLKGASSVAVDTAQVILMDQSLSQLCQLFDLAQDYEDKMKSTFRMVLVPSIIGMIGALFIHFGFIAVVLLNQFGFLASIANTTMPLLKENKQTKRLQRSQSKAMSWDATGSTGPYEHLAAD